MANVFNVVETSEFIGYPIQTEVCGCFTTIEKAKECLEDRKKVALEEFNMTMDGEFEDYIINSEDYFSIVTDDNFLSVEIMENELK